MSYELKNKIYFIIKNKTFRFFIVIFKLNKFFLTAKNCI